MNKKLVKEKKLVKTASKRSKSVRQNRKELRQKNHESDRGYLERSEMEILWEDDRISKAELNSLINGMRKGYFTPEEVTEGLFHFLDGWYDPNEKTTIRFLDKNKSQLDDAENKILTRILEHKEGDYSIRLLITGFEEVYSDRYDNRKSTDFVPQYTISKVIDNGNDEIYLEFFIVDGKINTY